MIGPETFRATAIYIIRYDMRSKERMVILDLERTTVLWQSKSLKDCSSPKMFRQVKRLSKNPESVLRGLFASHNELRELGIVSNAFYRFCESKTLYIEANICKIGFEEDEEVCHRASNFWGLTG